MRLKMRRSGAILVSGVLLAVAAYFGLYYVGTASSRRLERSQQPELAWLKQEFHLSDAEYDRVCRMHEGYLAGCAERCRRIDEKNAELRRLLAATNTVTPEIAVILSEAAQLRSECEKQMLQHFYDVSRTMPPDEGRRYLAWVQARTVLSDTHSQMTGVRDSAEPAMSQHHHHGDTPGHDPSQH
jgi:hypothetical protein